MQDEGEEFKLTSFTHKERPNHFQNLRISTFSPRSPKKLPPCHEKQGSPLRGVVHPHHTGLAPSQHISIVVCVAKKAKKQTEISTLVRYCWRRRLYLIFIRSKKKRPCYYYLGVGDITFHQIKAIPLGLLHCIAPL